MPSAIVRICAERRRRARGQRRRVRGRALGLHADDPHAGVRRRAARDAAEQAAAAGRDEHRRHVRALLDDLQPDGALAGDDVGVVERVHEHRAGALGELARRCDEALVDRRADQVHGRRRTRGSRRPSAAPPAPA